MQIVQTLQEALIAAIDDHDTVTLELGAVVETDLSFIQLVEVGRREASRRGKTMVLAAPACGVVRETLERAGFLSAADDDAHAFWFHGEYPQ